MWSGWLESESTMSLPLWRTFFLISIPCRSKKPFLIPRSSGNPFAIGSVSRVITVALAVRGALAALPPKTASAETAPGSRGSPPRRLPSASRPT
jgi:hypothetical protein